MKMKTLNLQKKMKIKYYCNIHNHNCKCAEVVANLQWKEFFAYSEFII